MKIELTSASRYNGGANVKRAHGSSTVTVFWVHLDGLLLADVRGPITFKGFGATPGARKTNAKEAFLRWLREEK